MAPRALVTGSGGLIGSHLVQHLAASGSLVTAGFHGAPPPAPSPGVTVLRLDVEDRAAVAAVVREAAPDVVYHLAARSLPRESWDDPEAFVAANIGGTLHLLDAVRAHAPAARLVIAGTSQEYAPAPLIDEQSPMAPASPYAVTKAAANMLAGLYREAYGLHPLIVRPFLLVGPGKIGDALSDFARGIVEVERGRATALRVGTLDVVRDLLDVRDGVRALQLIAEQGVEGEAYNICSGEGVSMRDALDLMVAVAAVPVRVEFDPARVRPVDHPRVVGSPAKLQALSWTRTIPLEQTVRDILEWARERAE